MIECRALPEYARWTRQYLSVCQHVVNVGAQPVPDGVQSLDGHILEAVGASLHIAEDLVDAAPHRSQT
jgi:hypothetical protein